MLWAKYQAKLTVGSALMKYSIFHGAFVLKHIKAVKCTRAIAASALTYLGSLTKTPLVS